MKKPAIHDDPAGEPRPVEKPSSEWDLPGWGAKLSTDRYRLGAAKPRANGALVANELVPEELAVRTGPNRRGSQERGLDCRPDSFTAFRIRHPSRVANQEDAIIDPTPGGPVADEISMPAHSPR